MLVVHVPYENTEIHILLLIDAVVRICNKLPFCDIRRLSCLSPILLFDNDSGRGIEKQ